MAQPLPTIKPPWQACVLVCSKCTKKIGKSSGKKVAKRFLGDLYDALRDRFGKKRMQLLEVGCLDLCPKGRITVAVSGPGVPLQVMLALPEATAEQILAPFGTAPTP